MKWCQGGSTNPNVFAEQALHEEQPEFPFFRDWRTIVKGRPHTLSSLSSLVQPAAASRSWAATRAAAQGAVCVQYIARTSLLSPWSALAGLHVCREDPFNKDCKTKRVNWLASSSSPHSLQELITAEQGTLLIYCNSKAHGQWDVNQGSIYQKVGSTLTSFSLCLLASYCFISKVNFIQLL